MGALHGCHTFKIDPCNDLRSFAHTMTSTVRIVKKILLLSILENMMSQLNMPLEKLDSIPLPCSALTSSDMAAAKHNKTTDDSSSFSL